MKFTAALVAVIGVAQADFISGGVATTDRYTYGKFITRMKTPDRKGTVASFYTYWDGPGFYPGGWNEIDINVVPAHEGNPISTNAIYGDGIRKVENHDYADQNVKTGWHTYELEWTPEYIAYSVDGNQIRKIDNDENSATNFMHKAQQLRMNFWTPTIPGWGDGLQADEMPWYLLYDYVEVYRYNKDSNSFEFDWRDDFNEFNQTRWHKMSGTFESNSSVFYPNHVYTQNGNLVIKMENDDHHEHSQTEWEEEHIKQMRYRMDHHYDIEHHRQREYVHHFEHDPMIHDAIGGLESVQKDREQRLGSLTPRGGDLVEMDLNIDQKEIDRKR